MGSISRTFVERFHYRRPFADRNLAGTTLFIGTDTPFMAPTTGNYQLAPDTPIKLVIWDLDDTFWQGTLSEGPITPLEANLELVRDTAARGLVHTIVSKNDFAPAEARLRELGIWELFVFARISWQPKGPVIRELLEPDAAAGAQRPVSRR